MELLEKSKYLSNEILKHIIDQNRTINNIYSNSIIIDDKLSYSEKLTYRIKNFFYRISHSNFYNSDLTETINDEINTLSIDKNKEDNPFNLLKKNNILIGQILDNQNEKLNDIQQKNSNNNSKIKDLLSTLS